MHDQINEPRYPTVKGIMAAKKKPVETWSLADLGVDAELVGLGGGVDPGGLVHPASPAHPGQIVPDEGEGRHQAGRVPRRAEVHLRQAGPPKGILTHV